MFTGIITSMGTVAALERSPGGVRLTMKVGFDLSDVALGASISHAGCCLTVVTIREDGYDLDVSNETLQVTNLNTWQVGTKVNLERALKIGDELGGHIVSGHVDGLAELISVTQDGSIFGCVVAHKAHEKSGFSALGKIRTPDASPTWTFEAKPESPRSETEELRMLVDALRAAVRVLTRDLKNTKCPCGAAADAGASGLCVRTHHGGSVARGILPLYRPRGGRRRKSADRNARRRHPRHVRAAGRPADPT